jgi:peptidoglycan/LPS O-acetylase OafA/YrhL
MRIILAMWVVLYHHISPDSMLGPYMAYLPRPLFSLAATGYSAVGVFFVLSGFILAINYPLAERWGKSESIRFGIARLARIYPIYLLGLLLSIPVKHLIHHPAVEGVRGLLNFSLLQSWWPPALGDAGGAGVWNPPGWSLSNEAFFYLIFPVVGVLLWRISRLRTLLMTTALLWACAMAAPLLTVPLHLPTLSISAIAQNRRSFALDLVRYDPLLRLPEFLMGVASARVYTIIRHRLQGKGMWLYLPALASMLIIFTHGDSFLYPIMHNGLVAPFTCCIIVGFALGGGWLCKLLSTRPMVFLGGASYAVYVLHRPIDMWLERLHLPWYRGLIGMAFYVFAVVSLSSLAFKYLEEPANLWLKKKLGGWINTSKGAGHEPSASHSLRRLQLGVE